MTDPPFFDNVHYSELADFFVAWQSLKPRGFVHSCVTTRSEKEVQDRDGGRFAAKLGSVFVECQRVLKDDGLLVLTYHNSRADGWASLASAIVRAGFSVVNAHPVKAEMSVAAPKSQAKEPIQLDVILVCRKRAADRRVSGTGAGALPCAFNAALAKAARLRAEGLHLSRNDRRVILFSQFLAALGPIHDSEPMLAELAASQDHLEAALDEPSFRKEGMVIDRVLTSADALVQGSLFS